MVAGWEWCRQRCWKVKSVKIIEDLYQGAQTFSVSSGEPREISKQGSEQSDCFLIKGSVRV